ncbi:rhomboid-related protein 2-like [Diabrotica undecimpunctata]|uniref:rhomboid-related protein 2-like n=1 Tax=Diabrotica undecimpunctata TaxID=50387 RepID=UPI003B640F29
MSHRRNLLSKYINQYIRYLIPRRQHQKVPNTEDVQTDGTYEQQYYSIWPPPLVILIMSILQLIFFIVSINSGEGSWDKALIYIPQKRKEVWRYFTYSLVHIGYPHLILNLVVQLILGLPLEIVHKKWRVLIVYLAGVLAGSLGSTITHPNNYLYGASAGVYALLVAHIGTIIINWREMTLPGIQLGGFLSIIVFNIIFILIDNDDNQQNGPIGHTAHIAGAITGLLVGIYILKNFDPSTRTKTIFWIGLIVYIICTCILICFNIFLSNILKY